MQINECTHAHFLTNILNLVTITLDVFAGALYLDDASRDFGPEIALRFQIPSLLERQGGREMSNPSQYLTDPFHTASQLGLLNVF